MEDELRAKLRAYGRSFDDVVDLVANSMRAIGFPSKHASVDRSEVPNELKLLRSRISGLGMLCLHMGNQFAERTPPGEIGELTGVDTLAVASEAGRLVSLLREAQRTRVLTGLAAAELDGDIDELEERFLRLDDFAALVEAAESMIIGARPFADGLPGAIRESLAKLEGLLSIHG